MNHNGLFKNKKGLASGISFSVMFLILVGVAIGATTIAISNAVLETSDTQQNLYLYEYSLKTSNELSALLSSNMEWEAMCSFFENSYSGKYHFQVVMGGTTIHSCGTPPGDVNYLEERAYLPAEDKQKIEVILQKW